ncbi:radical SAM protein [Candidatus Woesearchaeota archaeon]|nr:radical SAM protein [Candidatus Woesearchaeota archaeon]
MKISKQDLENKVREFAKRETKHLDSFVDFNFENNLMRLPLETKDGHVIEATLCYGYKQEKYLLAMSAQVGCATKCNFCDLGDLGYKRDLTADELLDELVLLLSTAMKRGYNVFDRPLKATFVMGGEPLANRHFGEALARMKEQVPLQTKVSTIFPGTKRSLQVYREVVDVAKEYPNIVQFQVSLNSTDEDYRQSLVAIPLADYKTLRKAGEEWFEKVPDPRKINLTFTLNQETPMDPDQIKDVLTPDIFAIRLRDWVPTERGERYGIRTITNGRVYELKSMFEDCGYFFVPGMSGHVEQKFKLAPGESLKLYQKMRNRGE